MKLAQSKVHFIGIGGIGMCGLAELLSNMGAHVSGSDLSANKQTDYLKNLGINIFIGQRAEQIVDQDVVVYSSAIKPDNVEFKQARTLNIPLIARAEALAEIMRIRRGIAVGGTHGKTTTTSMLASLFLSAKLDPTVVVGGRLDLFKSTAKLGSGEWLIAEADESDGSFHRLSPENVIITNVDNDHLDHYQSLENIERAFYEFALRIPFYGTAIVCGDDPRVRELFADFPKRLLFYGFDKKNDYILNRENGVNSIEFQGKVIAEIDMPMPGHHNSLNALAAFIAGHVAGISVADCVSGIEGFGGVDRRFQFKAEKDGVIFYDDYGHHPTEVKAVLQAVNEKFSDRRVVVIFQPHRYSRTRDCWNDFLTSFSGVDKLIVLEVYPAGEKPIDGVNGAEFSQKVECDDVEFIENKDQAPQLIRERLRDGDICLTLGAGDVWRVGERIYKGSGEG